MMHRAEDHVNGQFNFFNLGNSLFFYFFNVSHGLSGGFFAMCSCCCAVSKC